MTPKDTGFIQQHIEKVVLAVALLFVLIVLWLYYLGNPYSVKLAAHDDVPPAEVMDVIKQKAQVLKGKLDLPQSPLPQTPVPDYTKEFVNRSQRPLLPTDTYPIAFGEPGLGDFKPAPPKTRYVIMPPIPAPTRIKARAGFNVLAEFEDAQQASPFIQLIGEQTPRDFDYASVSAVFSVDELQQAIKAVAIDDRIPEAWWKNRLMIVRVEMQRSELDSITGQWSKEITVPPLPHQVAYDVEPKEEYQQIEAGRIIEQLPLDQNLIQRPPFPPTINEWTPPDIDVTQRSPEENRKLMTLDGEIARLRRQIQSLERRTPPGADVTRSPAVAGDSSSQIEQFRATVIQKVNERNQLLGIDIKPTDGTGMPVGPPDDMGRFRPSPSPGHRSPPDAAMDPNAPQSAHAGEVKVWGHDLTVEPAKTYRYRLIVHVLNPLFQKHGIDPEQEKQNFHKLSIASRPSEWSEPVTTEPEVRFFLVRAGTTSAEVEVYRIFNGMWEMRSFTVRPGQMIGEDVDINSGSQPVKLPMKINGMLVDLREVNTGGAVRDSTYEMLYVDLDNRNLQVRDLNQDLNHPDLLRLRAERARNAVALQP